MEEGCFDLCCPRRAPLLRYHVFPLFPSRPRRCHSAGATHGGGLFLRSKDFLWAIGRFVARNRQEKHCIVLQQNGHAKWTPRFQIVPSSTLWFPAMRPIFSKCKQLLVFLPSADAWDAPSADLWGGGKLFLSCWWHLFGIASSLMAFSCHISGTHVCFFLVYIYISIYLQP